MGFLEDPDQMTPEARLAELAAILALGCSRLFAGEAKHAATPAAPQIHPEKGLDSLPPGSSALGGESTEIAEGDQP